MSSFSSWFFLILQNPFSSCIGPKIFLSIFSSDILSCSFWLVNIQASHPYVTTGLIKVLCNDFILNFYVLGIPVYRYIFHICWSHCTYCVLSIVGPVYAVLWQNSWCVDFLWWTVAAVILCFCVDWCMLWFGLWRGVSGFKALSRLFMCIGGYNFHKHS